MTNLEFDNIDITENWDGYFLNHLVNEDHPNVRNLHRLPSNVNWDNDLMAGISIYADPPISFNWLWAAKVWYLYNNPESEDQEVIDRIPIVVCRYDYGSFNGLLAEKSDQVLYCPYKETEESLIEIKPYKVLPERLQKLGDKDKLVEKRRRDAIAYLKQAGAELNLVTEIANLFEEFNDLINLYINSGNLNLIDAIKEKENVTEYQWLENDIEGEENVKNKHVIYGTLESATQIVTQQNIDDSFDKLVASLYSQG